MSHEDENSMEALWREYSRLFQNFDDLTLARWMAQTLGQLQGQGWRFSHPLVAAYRLAAHVGHDRQIWLKRLVALPAAYPEAPCCCAPLLPMLARDVLETGLVCVHCNETAIPFEELPADIQILLRSWAEEYHPIHAVAHWDVTQQQRVTDYDTSFDEAANKAENLLVFLAHQIVPRLLEVFPTILWEDQDDCLDVHPEDVKVI